MSDPRYVIATVPSCGNCGPCARLERCIRNNPRTALGLPDAEHVRSEAHP